MAEEIKQEEKKCCSVAKVSSSVIKVVLGLIFLALGALMIIRWWGNLLMVVKGCLGPFLLLAGVITLAIAKE